MQLIENEQKKTLEIPELIPVSRFNDFVPYPKVGALRQYIFYSHKYKFDKVIRRIGKRMYISYSAFQEWVKEQTREYIED